MTKLSSEQFSLLKNRFRDMFYSSGGWGQGGNYSGDQSALFRLVFPEWFRSLRAAQKNDAIEVNDDLRFFFEATSQFQQILTKHQHKIFIQFVRNVLRQPNQRDLIEFRQLGTLFVSQMNLFSRAEFERFFSVDDDKKPEQKTNIIAVIQQLPQKLQKNFHSILLAEVKKIINNKKLTYNERAKKLMLFTRIHAGQLLPTRCIITPIKRIMHPHVEKIIKNFVERNWGNFWTQAELTETIRKPILKFCQETMSPLYTLERIRDKFFALFSQDEIVAMLPTIPYKRIVINRTNIHDLLQISNVIRPDLQRIVLFDHITSYEARLLTDTLRMIIQLSDVDSALELKNLRNPNDIKRIHDIIQKKQWHKNNPNVIYQTQHKIFLDEENFLETPADSHTLSSWGQEMNNCIASYSSRHEKGAIIIFRGRVLGKEAICDITLVQAIDRHISGRINNALWRSNSRMSDEAQQKVREMIDILVDQINMQKMETKLCETN